MALNAGLFDLGQGVALGDGGVAFGAFYLIGHRVRLGLFFAKALSPDELGLAFVTIGAF